MTHLLSLEIVQTAICHQSYMAIAVGVGAVLGEVDFMVEKGGLGGGSGQYGYLSKISVRPL